MKSKGFLSGIVLIIMFFLMTANGVAQSSNPENAPEPTTKSESNTTQPSASVPSGDTVKVKGLDDWEGEITGKPAPGSKFEKLQIGMNMKDVVELIGKPDSKSRSITGKAFIPFYGGSDRSRYEMVYKDHGRLIFSRSSRFSNSYNLTAIVHNAKEILQQ